MHELKKLIEEMRQKAIAEMPVDPKQSALRLLDSITIMTELTRGAPSRVYTQMMEGLVAEHLDQYRTKIQNELLESQRSTNDALAAALNMSAERKAEKK